MKKQVYHKSKQKPQIGLSLIVLRDKYGFGKKRLEAFADEFLKQLKCVENGAVTLEELHEVIKKETGMEVKFK